MKDLPAEFAEAIPPILTESGFGDFYTSGELDTKTRELLIFYALATLGGTERQMASHAVGNLKVGNSKETLLSAMVHSYHIYRDFRIICRATMIRPLQSRTSPNTALFVSVLIGYADWRREEEQQLARYGGHRPPASKHLGYRLGEPVFPA